MSENGHNPPPAGPPQLQHGDLPVDLGNRLLAIVPCALTASVQETSAGQRTAVTVRTVDTTITVFLAKDELDSWIDVLTQTRARMTGLILPG